MIDAQSVRLIEIVQKLSQCESLDAIIHLVKSSARELAKADGATFVLKENDQCHYVDEDALTPLFKGKHFPANICVSGAAMVTREAILIPDIYEDARIPIEIYRPTFVKSMCMTPIRSAAPIGAIGVYWKDHHETSEGERLLLKALADSCSIAMENVSLQTELKAKLEQIVRLNRLKDEFLRNLSHELRTPLNIILGWTQLLSSDASPEEIAEAVAQIEVNGRRQDQIIKDLLDCSNLISGQLEFHASNFDLATLIEPLLDSLDIAVQSKKISVRLDSLDTESLVNADQDRCREVLWHLFSNAIKFTPKSGEIAVRCYRDDGYAIVEISDNGIGINSEFLPKVFDLFTQEDSGLSRAYPGTGLGLSIARYFTEAQGGILEVESEGKTMGTRVRFKLPVAAIRFVPKKNSDPAYMTQVFHHLLQSKNQESLGIVSSSSSAHLSSTISPSVR